MIIARTIQCSTSLLGEVTHHCGVESYCIYACNKTHLHFQTALHSSGTIRQFQLSTMFSFSLPKKNRGWKSILSLSHHIPVLCIYYQQCTYQIIIYIYIYIFLNVKPSQTYLLGILWQELDRFRKGPDQGPPTKPGWNDVNLQNIIPRKRPCRNKSKKTTRKAHDVWYLLPVTTPQGRWKKDETLVTPGSGCKVAARCTEKPGHSFRYHALSSELSCVHSWRQCMSLQTLQLGAKSICGYITGTIHTTNAAGCQINQ
jgi:hypothetical protein